MLKNVLFDSEIIFYILLSSQLRTSTASEMLALTAEFLQRFVPEGEMGEMERSSVAPIQKCSGTYTHTISCYSQKAER